MPVVSGIDEGVFRIAAASEQIQLLQRKAVRGPITLFNGAGDEEHNEAIMPSESIAIKMSAANRKVPARPDSPTRPRIVAPKLKEAIVPRDSYSRSPEVVARDLLGKLLIRHLDGERLTGRIVEVEAYLGLSDPASHAAIGLTPNNAVLFGPPGLAHVYFIYGMHYCLSISCLPKGQAGGVLIRALDPLEGLGTMARLRRIPSNAKPRMLTGGPDRLCQAIGITRAVGDGLDVTRSRSTLQIAGDGSRPDEIEITPRIGIRKAVDRPLRFLVAGPKSSQSRN